MKKKVGNSLDGRGLKSKLPLIFMGYNYIYYFYLFRQLGETGFVFAGRFSQLEGSGESQAALRSRRVGPRRHVSTRRFSTSSKTNHPLNAIHQGFQQFFIFYFIKRPDCIGNTCRRTSKQCIGFISQSIYEYIYCISISMLTCLCQSHIYMPYVYMPMPLT